MKSCLDRRVLTPEMMDGPDLDRARHLQALRGLARINFFTATARLYWPHLEALWRHGQGKPLRILDVATGGADVPIELSKRARRIGMKLVFEGCDFSPVALSHARENAEKASASMTFFESDVIHDSLPSGYDAVICSHFLHHIQVSEAGPFLVKLSRSAKRLLLVQDLTRNLGSFLFTYFGVRIISRSPVVHVDGPRSVRAAFIVNEVARIAGAAGLNGATVTAHWPFRLLLRWERQAS